MTAKSTINLDAIKQQIAEAHRVCEMRGLEKIDIRLLSPYAPVTVHRSGAVTVTKTGMRLFSLEVTP